MSQDQFEARLRRITAEADARPDLILDAARAALSMRTVDAELAELVADSALDDSGLLTRRVVSDVRMISFECGDVTVELDITTQPDGTASVRGVATGAAGTVSVVRSGERYDVELDDAGRFSADLAMGGPLRLELITPAGARVTTSWVTV